MRREQFEHEPAARTSRKRFSLIELLVVIAIIALLTSLLLPALGKAKEQGRKIACAGNLKQIYCGAMLYVSDNDGYLPHVLDLYGGTIIPLVNEYLKQNCPAPYQYGSGSLIIFPRPEGMYFCPSTRKAPDSPCWQGGAEGTAGYFNNYAATLRHFGNPRCGGWYYSDAQYAGNYDRCRRLEMVKDGAAMLGEKDYAVVSNNINQVRGIFSPASGSDSTKLPKTSIYSLGWNHFNASNLMFKDGHASSITYTGSSQWDDDFVMR